MASESPASQQYGNEIPGKGPPHVLACAFCHQRKIKCDRKSPCANCIKADQPCIPSTRAPAGAGRRRVVKDLLERLNQCESLLSQVAPRNAADGRSSVSAPAGTGMTPPPPPSLLPPVLRDAAAAVDSPSMSWVSYEEARKQPSQRPNGKIVIDEGRRTFMESPLRLNVVDHLQFSKMSLNDPVDEQVHHYHRHHHQSGSASMTAKTNDNDDDGNLHFDLVALGAVEMLRLWQIFLERVNPMTKVLHVPSLEPLVFEAATDHGNVAPDLEALFCSINVLAVMALSEAESEQILKVAKLHALKKANLALRRALCRVDFLRKYNLTVLQSLVLYLVSLQGQFDRHASWILTGMLVRIAQRMGLHRDGELLGLEPFETEMRRRIWWQIIMLETKYAILAGFCDTLLPPNWDTRLPSNLNDADLLPGKPDPVKSREGATEMAFCLMMYEAKHFFCENPVPEFEAVVLGTGGDDVNLDYSMSRKKMMNNSGRSNMNKRQNLDKYRVIVDQLDERLLKAERRYCNNPTIGGIHVLACKLRHLIAERMREMITHAQPLRRRDETLPKDDDGALGGQSQQQRQHQQQQQSLFRMWVIHFENDLKWYDTIDDRFRWYPKLHLQADAFSVMIEMLQWQPAVGSPVVDRAWKVIDRVYYHHPDLYDLGKTENLQRAESLVAGWQRREVFAFCQLGPCQAMETTPPVVINRLRGSGRFPPPRTMDCSGFTAPFEEEPFAAAAAPVPTTDKTTRFPGFVGNLGFQRGEFDGSLPLNSDGGGSFFWDILGEHSRTH